MGLCVSRAPPEEPPHCSACGWEASAVWTWMSVHERQQWEYDRASKCFVHVGCPCAPEQKAAQDHADFERDRAIYKQLKEARYPRRRLRPQLCRILTNEPLEATPSFCRLHDLRLSALEPLPEPTAALQQPQGEGEDWGEKEEEEQEWEEEERVELDAQHAEGEEEPSALAQHEEDGVEEAQPEQGREVVGQEQQEEAAQAGAEPASAGDDASAAAAQPEEQVGAGTLAAAVSSMRGSEVLLGSRVQQQRQAETEVEGAVERLREEAGLTQERGQQVQQQEGQAGSCLPAGPAMQEDSRLPARPAGPAEPAGPAAQVTARTGAPAAEEEAAAESAAEEESAAKQPTAAEEGHAAGQQEAALAAAQEKTAAQAAPPSASAAGLVAAPVTAADRGQAGDALLADHRGQAGQAEQAVLLENGLHPAAHADVLQHQGAIAELQKTGLGQAGQEEGEAEQLAERAQQHGLLPQSQQGEAATEPAVQSGGPWQEAAAQWQVAERQKAAVHQEEAVQHGAAVQQEGAAVAEQPLQQQLPARLQPPLPLQVEPLPEEPPQHKALQQAEQGALHPVLLPVLLHVVPPSGVRDAEEELAEAEPGTPDAVGEGEQAQQAQRAQQAQQAQHAPARLTSAPDAVLGLLLPDGSESFEQQQQRGSLPGDLPPDAAAAGASSDEDVSADDDMDGGEGDGSASVYASASSSAALGPAVAQLPPAAQLPLLGRAAEQLSGSSSCCEAPQRGAASAMAGALAAAGLIAGHGAAEEGWHDAQDTSGSL